VRRGGAAGPNLTLLHSPLVVGWPVPKGHGNQERQPAQKSLQPQELIARISTVFSVTAKSLGKQVSQALAMLTIFESRLNRVTYDQIATAGLQSQ